VLLGQLLTTLARCSAGGADRFNAAGERFGAGAEFF
jgi:hypothetical protein